MSNTFRKFLSPAFFDWTKGCLKNACGTTLGTGRAGSTPATLKRVLICGDPQSLSHKTLVFRQYSGQSLRISKNARGTTSTFNRVVVGSNPTASIQGKRSSVVEHQGVSQLLVFEILIF